MYHSITFGNKNTWDDWHLIPSSRPVFNPPIVKTSYVELPGGDGNIDLTEALVGRPLYGNRTGSFDFIVDNGHAKWIDVYSDIMNYFQGKEMAAVLEDEPEYFYFGRYAVTSWASEANNSRISISYTVDPYKYNVGDSNELWEWDSFNFNTGVIRYFKNMPVKGQLRVRLVGTKMPTALNVTSTHAMDVDFYGLNESSILLTEKISPGRTIVSNIVLMEGENILVFRGNGVISIDYRGGKL